MAVVGAGVARVANQEVKMGPYTIPKNTLLWVPLQALQTSPALWEQPDAFMPVSTLLHAWSSCTISRHTLHAAEELAHLPTLVLESWLASVLSVHVHEDAHKRFGTGLDVYMKPSIRCVTSTSCGRQERWLEEDAEYWTPQPSTRDSSAASGAAEKQGEGQGQRFKKFMPFGEGMRGCVGQSLAKMNYTAATALLLSHFTFRLADRVRTSVSTCAQAFYWIINCRLMGSVAPQGLLI